MLLRGRTGKLMLALIFCTALVTTSCVDKAAKYMSRGKFQFQREEFELAAEDLKQAIAFGETKPRSFTAEANFFIAESYRQSNRLHEAEKYYREALKQGYVNDHADFYMGYALKANGKYVSAKNQFKRYVKLGSNYEYVQRAKKEVRNLIALSEIAKKRPEYKIQNFKELNTESIEYSPMMYGKKMYFTSSRGEGVVYTGQGTRFTDMYEWTFDKPGSMSGFARPLNVLVNDPNRHEATTTFSPDGQTMIFSRSSNGKKKDITQEVDLFQSKLVNGDWSEPERLNISETFYWDSNPFLSPDGKTLFFSSNREGGQGGDDLWQATLNDEGEWDNVKNLGKKINTEGDEQFPYLDRAGNFYFSSDGHPGFGELDLFIYHKNEEGKRVVDNMGAPVNSSYDDFGLILTEEDKGYFCSNRPDGQGDDDIYYFEYDYEIKYWMDVLVKGRTLNSKGELTDSLILLANSHLIVGNDKDTIRQEVVTDENGYFRFEVQPEMMYLLHADQRNYLSADRTFSTMGTTAPEDSKEDVFFQTELVLDPIAENVVVKFEPIYYPYNEWTITPKAEEVLIEMVKVMKQNPTILVELGSHTDARGSANFNKKLSQNRAESAVEWIISHGIPQDRITAKGYGEQVPLELKSDTGSFNAGTLLTHIMLDSLEQAGDTTSSEFGHQMNRRTEFKIVGQIEEELDVNDIEVIDSGKEEEIIEEEKIENEEEIIEKYLDKDDVILPPEEEEGDAPEGTTPENSSNDR